MEVARQDWAMTNRLTEADMNPLKRAELRIVMSAAQPLRARAREIPPGCRERAGESLRSDLGPGLVRASRARLSASTSANFHPPWRDRGGTTGERW